MVRTQLIPLLLLLLVSNFTAPKLVAQVFDEVDEGEEYFDVSSPYNTIFTHLYNLQPENFNPEVAARTVTYQDLKLKRRQEVAIKIKRILDGTGNIINLDEVPRDPDYQDTLAKTVNKHKYVLTSDYPDIYLEKIGDRWLYSSKTVRHVDDIYYKIYPFGTDKLMNLLPMLGNRKFMGFFQWQLVWLFITILASVIFYKLFTLFFQFLFTRIIARVDIHDEAKKIIQGVARPTSSMLVVFILLVFVPLLQLPIKTAHYVILALRALWPLFATIIAYRIVDLAALYFAKLAEKTPSTLDDQLVPLLKKAFKTFVVIVGTLFILDNLRFDIIPLLTGLSIGGLAFALAAQDTIKNFFGSLMIFIDKPFHIGDWITTTDLDGTVEEVGFRSTRVRTFRNSVVSVPNGKLADLTIDNHGLRVYRRFYTTIAITYDTPPDRIELFVDGLRKIIENHPHTRKDYYHVYLNDLGSSSLNVMFYIFFAVPSWPEELRCRHEVLLEIINLAEFIGIRFAFPTQTLHMETVPGQVSLTPTYQKVTPELKAEMETFLLENKKS